MTATRENLIEEARNIRLSLPDLTSEEITEAIRVVLRHYSPQSTADAIEAIISESRLNIAESA